jgi:hypothetical protein
MQLPLIKQAWRLTQGTVNTRTLFLSQQCRGDSQETLGSMLLALDLHHIILIRLQRHLIPRVPKSPRNTREQDTDGRPASQRPTRPRSWVTPYPFSQAHRLQ